jgi:hypothetical protein
VRRAPHPQEGGVYPYFGHHRWSASVVGCQRGTPLHVSFNILIFLIASLQATLFDDYRIESKNNNEIAFELSLDNVLRGLKSGILLLLLLLF